MYAGPPGSGGFLVFPGGTFVADPRSAVAVPSPPPGYTPPPGGYGPGPGAGNFGLSYDRAMGRWLPVQRNWVSPDGKRYAYVYPGAEGIYVIDVASGVQTEVGDGQVWNLLDVAANGVYAGSATGPGLWLLPFTGLAKQLSATGYWQAVGGGAAYGTSTSAVPQGASNVILRLDLSSGSSQPWFTVQGGQSYVLGFDIHGAPIIVANFNGGSNVWLVPGLGQGEVIEPANNFSGLPVADTHGIWFPNWQQTFLFIRGMGTYVAANIGGQIAGGCA